jgi:hypothetical protein
MQIFAAADSVDITPAEMLPLAGFQGRQGSATGVADRLEMNAVLFRDETGRSCVIVSVDTLYVGPTLNAEIAAHLCKRYGFQVSDVLCLASHTHFAPGIDTTKPNRLAPVDGGYLAMVIDRAKALLDRLLGTRLLRVDIGYAEQSWNGAVNRRKPWRLPHFNERGRLTAGEIAMAPNPGAPNHPVLQLWSLCLDDGSPLAVIWTACCHPTGAPLRSHVSAEFPGFGRAHIRQRCAKPLPVVFMQGFAGNLRPATCDTRPFLRRISGTLRRGPSFHPFDLAAWKSWLGRLGDALDKAMTTANEDRILRSEGRIASKLAGVNLSQLIDGCDEPSRSVQFARLAIGEALEIVAVAAEPSVELRNLAPFPGAALTGYMGDAFGYWPTARQASEGGYEGGGFFDGFGLRGAFRSDLDQTFSAAMASLQTLTYRLGTLKA